MARAAQPHSGRIWWTISRATRSRPAWEFRSSTVLMRSTDTTTCMAQRSFRITSGWELCRSEEHTSELQSRLHLVCRLLLEKKKEIPTGTVTRAMGDVHPLGNTHYLLHP